MHWPITKPHAVQHDSNFRKCLLTGKTGRRSFDMARHLEIERKFLVKQPPTGWKGRPSSRIVQGYLPITSKLLEIRLRRKGLKRFITVKCGHGRRRLEEEIDIPESKFCSLWPLTRQARVVKRRYKIPSDRNTIEMDVYEGAHRGLITADIEFDSVGASRAFEPPDWLGREITGNRQYANEALARCHKLPRELIKG